MNLDPYVAELGDQLHKVQRKLRDLKQEERELRGQLAVFTQRFAAQVNGSTAFESSDGYIKIVDITNEPDEDDIDVEEMIRILKSLRRKIPYRKKLKAVVSYATNDTNLEDYE